MTQGQVPQRISSQVLKMMSIVPTGQMLRYEEAFMLVRDKGGLPPNALYHHLLIGSLSEKKGDPIGDILESAKTQGEWPGEAILSLAETQRALESIPAWAREILVYPAAGEVFRKGVDVVDGKRTFPGSSIPEEAIGREKVGLFVNPLDLDIRDGRVTVIPKNVTTLSGFLQKDGRGRPDPDTKIPLEYEGESLPLTETGHLCRAPGSGPGVRPLAIFGSFYNLPGLYVVGAYEDTYGLNVSSVKLRPEETNPEAKNAALVEAFVGLLRASS